MRIDTAHIQRIADEVRDILGEDFDAETFWDSLDGEADALDIADHLLAQRMEARANAEALAFMIDTYKARKARMESRAARYTDLLGVLLAATGERKLERPGATVSIRKGADVLVIEDEGQLPSQLMTVKTTRTPDKMAIKAQLKAGEKVPGAKLEKGADVISVRVK